MPANVTMANFTQKTIDRSSDVLKLILWPELVYPFGCNPTASKTNPLGQNETRSCDNSTAPDQMLLVASMKLCFY